MLQTAHHTRKKYKLKNKSVTYKKNLKIINFNPDQFFNRTGTLIRDNFHADPIKAKHASPHINILCKKLKPLLQ